MGSPASGTHRPIPKTSENGEKPSLLPQREGQRTPLGIYKDARGEIKRAKLLWPLSGSSQKESGGLPKGEIARNETTPLGGEF
jgi:hypothetical protein